VAVAAVVVGVAEVGAVAVAARVKVKANLPHKVKGNNRLRRDKGKANLPHKVKGNNRLPRDRANNPRLRAKARVSPLHKGKGKGKVNSRHRVVRANHQASLRKTQAQAPLRHRRVMAKKVPRQISRAR
jgi:hypothetical protein